MVLHLSLIAFLTCSHWNVYIVVLEKHIKVVTSSFWLYTIVLSQRVIIHKVTKWQEIGRSIVTLCIGRLSSTHSMRCVSWHNSHLPGIVTLYAMWIASLDFHQKSNLSHQINMLNANLDTQDSIFKASIWNHVSYSTPSSPILDLLRHLFLIHTLPVWVINIAHLVPIWFYLILPATQASERLPVWLGQSEACDISKCLTDKSQNI